MSEHKTKNYEARCLIQLLASLVNKDVSPKWSRKVDWGSVYKLADYHNVANDAYYMIMGKEEPDYGPWKKKFEDRFHNAAALEDRYKETINKLTEEFEKRKIHCMIINDFIMRNYYPRSEMRALDYVEVLVEPGKKELIELILKSMDFMEKKTREGQGFTYYKIPGINLTIVESLTFTNKKMHSYFNISVKGYGKKEGYRYIHENREEELYIYTIGYLGERYARGHLEIRDVLDFWFYYLKAYQSLDWEYIEKSLEKMGIQKFGECLVKLAAFWFGGMNFPAQLELLDSMEEYILTKGMKGRKESEQLLPLVKEVTDFYKRDIKKERREQKKKWMFPSMDYMSTLFPILENRPKMIKVFWVLRIFRSFIYTTKNLVLDYKKDISDKSAMLMKKYELRTRRTRRKAYAVGEKWREMREGNMEKVAGLLNRSKKKK